MLTSSNNTGVPGTGCSLQGPAKPGGCCFKDRKNREMLPSGTANRVRIRGTANQGIAWDSRKKMLHSGITQTGSVP
ncbi:hypothetical protein PBY51_001240 [Eleginops maclovinus]|uniref:Uncharacterized protein n=1 Tax=Eleginops maclovinus TaxID=56733 RepID=A0AAN7WMQ4_ELEMC|nr:hypothetical protein PBY51_001240 [Eleginops maclovinus]